MQIDYHNNANLSPKHSPTRHDGTKRFDAPPEAFFQRSSSNMASDANVKMFYDTNAEGFGWTKNATEKSTTTSFALQTAKRLDWQ